MECALLNCSVTKLPIDSFGQWIAAKLTGAGQGRPPATIGIMICQKCARGRLAFPVDSFVGCDPDETVYMPTPALTAAAIVIINELLTYCSNRLNRAIVDGINEVIVCFYKADEINEAKRVLYDKCSLEWLLYIPSS